MEKSVVIPTRLETRVWPDLKFYFITFSSSKYDPIYPESFEAFIRKRQFRAIVSL